MYKLIEEFYSYNGKLAARTGKNSSQIEIRMKTYKFDDKDPTSILCFPAQFKWACVRNELSKNTALWSISTLFKDRPASSLTVCVTPHNERETTNKLPKISKKEIFTNVGAARFLLNPITTKSDIVKVSLETITSSGTLVKALLQFPDVLHTKVVHCKNAYPNELTKKLLINGLPAKTQSAVRMLQVSR